MSNTSNTADDQQPDKHPGGRPLKFKTVKELQDRVEGFFADCQPHAVEVTEYVEARDSNGNLKKDQHGLNYLVQVTHLVMTQQQPLTITRLANWLNVDRKTLLNYKKRDKYFPTIDGALRRCEAFAEDMLYINPTGAKFTLINNYDWQEKQEIDHTSKGQVMPLLGGAVQLDPENVDEPEQPATE